MPFRSAALRRFGSVLAASLLVSSAALRAELDPAAAKQALLAQLANYGDPGRRLDRIIEIGFLDSQADPALRDAARQVALDYDPRLFFARSTPFYDRLSPENQLAMLRIYDTNFPNMKGYDYELNSVVARSVSSDDPEIRKLATEMACHYKVKEAYFPLRRRANRSTGEDRLEAIRAFGRLRDARAVYFLPALLDSKEKDVREAVFAALGQIGRPATLALKERLTHPDPQQRILALKALMPVALVDDLPTFYAFVQANPDLDEPLKNDLYALIARLEVYRDKGVETPRD